MSKVTLNDINVSYDGKNPDPQGPEFRGSAKASWVSLLGPSGLRQDDDGAGHRRLHHSQQRQFVCRRGRRDDEGARA